MMPMNVIYVPRWARHQMRAERKPDHRLCESYMSHFSLYLSRDGVRNRTAAEKKKVWFWLTAEENWISPVLFMRSRTSLPKVADSKATESEEKSEQRECWRDSGADCGARRFHDAFVQFTVKQNKTKQKRLESDYFNPPVIKSVGKNSKYVKIK